MGIDLNNDYEKAKTKINSFKTVAENKKTEFYQKKLKKPFASQETAGPQPPEACELPYCC